MSVIGRAAPFIVGAVSATVPPSTNLLEQWKLNVGLTQSGGTASAWLGQIAGYSLAQATGTKQPAVQGDGSLLFDGVDDFMTASFTLGQPYTIFLLAKQVTWTDLAYLCDGPTNFSGVVYSGGASPQIAAYAGASIFNSNLAVNTYGTICAVFNGASSVLQVDATTATTGDAGTGTPSGLTLGARGDGGAQWGNWQVKEVLIYNAALDATARADVRAYMASIP